MGSSRARERQRTAKACTRCRIKKIKCDGGSPCSCCRFQDTLCQYAERKHNGPRRVPSGYVEYLENQREFLVQVMKELWRSHPGRSTPGQRTKSRKRSLEPTLHDMIQDFGLKIEIPENYKAYEASGKNMEINDEEISGNEETQTSDYASASESGIEFDPSRDFDNEMSLLESDPGVSSDLFAASPGFTYSQTSLPPWSGDLFATQLPSLRRTYDKARSFTPYSPEKFNTASIIDTTTFEFEQKSDVVSLADVVRASHVSGAV